ncbi:MAG: helix-turn-helix domain-containing protein [Gemmatimonadaceae bacterium]
MKAVNSWAALLQEDRTRAAFTQRELARRAATAQSVVARIENGQTSPTADTIERLLSAAGFTASVELLPLATADPAVEAFKRDIDRSLLHRNLEKTPDERMRSLQALSRFADEARRAGRAVRNTR